METWSKQNQRISIVRIAPFIDKNINSGTEVIAIVPSSKKVQPNIKRNKILRLAMDPFDHKMTSDPKQRKGRRQNTTFVHYRGSYITLYTDDARDLNDRMRLSSWTRTLSGGVSRGGLELKLGLNKHTDPTRRRKTNTSQNQNEANRTLRVLYKAHVEHTTCGYIFIMTSSVR